MAQARILALKAESDESLTLIARGNGQADSNDFNTIVPQLGGSDGTTGLLGEASQQSAGAPMAFAPTTSPCSAEPTKRPRSWPERGQFTAAVD